MRYEIPDSKISKRIGRTEKNPRIDKGLSITYLPKDYCCIDIETTGYMPDFDEIIEFCGVKVRDSQIVEIYSTLIKPKNPIDDFIAEHTGITNDMLANQPGIEDVAGNIYDYLEGEIIMGQNVNFDINFLYDTLEKVLNKTLKNDFVDLMRVTRMLFREFDNHQLTTVAERLGVAMQTRHRAQPDCEITIACFEKSRDYAQKNDININSLFEKRKSKLRADEIESQKDEFDYDHFLYGKVCVFTGVLEKMLRREAMQCVVDLGGKCKDTVTKEVNFLVLGNNDYCSSIKEGKSNKHKKAEKLILQGHDIQVIPENVFYDLIFEE